jgi:hypothetical protein
LVNRSYTLHYFDSSNSEDSILKNDLVNNVIPNITNLKNNCTVLYNLVSLEDNATINYTDELGNTKSITTKKISLIIKDNLEAIINGTNINTVKNSVINAIDSQLSLLDSILKSTINLRNKLYSNWTTFFNKAITTHLYKNTDITLNIDSYQLYRANTNLTVLTSSCLNTNLTPNSDNPTYLNKSESTATSYSGTINKEKNYTINNQTISYQDLFKNVLKSIDFKFIDQIINVIKILNSLLNKYKNIIENYIDDYNTTIEYSYSLNDTFNQITNVFNAKNNLIQEKVFNDVLKHFKDHLNNYYLQINNKLTENITNTANINAEITNLQQLLNEVIDYEKPVKSIFSISNYQRIIYNYSYITQRLKIKYFEKEKVEDDIEIIENKLMDLYSQPVPDQGLIHELENLKASFQTLLEEINFEISTLTEEYNKIRVSYLGLEPIAENDPNFDPGKYAVTDLDCLETAE